MSVNGRDSSQGIPMCSGVWSIKCVKRGWQSRTCPARGREGWGRDLTLFYSNLKRCRPDGVRHLSYMHRKSTRGKNPVAARKKIPTGYRQSSQWEVKHWDSLLQKLSEFLSLKMFKTHLDKAGANIEVAPALSRMCDWVTFGGLFQPPFLYNFMILSIFSLLHHFFSLK